MEETKNLVSIIIPFYNGEKYIERCIKSILNQTYKKIEIIFINDGSNDRSIEKIKKYKDERIRLYNQEKKGVSVARNFGMKHANGEYLAFMDVDDELDEKYIEKFVETIKKENVDIVICNYNEIYSDKHKKEILLPWKNEIIRKEVIKNELIPRMIATQNDEEEIRGLVWRTFTKKKLIELNNIKFIENIKIAEDLLFVIQLYNKADAIFILEDCLYNYYKNYNSTLNKYLQNFVQDNINFHNNFVKILKEENLYENNEERYLKNRLQKYTVEISNAVRNDKIKEIYKEIKMIRKNYIEDNSNYKYRFIDNQRKLALFLLKYNFIILLIILFKIKENLRRRNFE